jgi:hypothetical protein
MRFSGIFISIFATEFATEYCAAAQPPLNILATTSMQGCQENQLLTQLF